MAHIRYVCALVALLFAAACTNDVSPSQLPQFHLSRVTVQPGPGTPVNASLASTTEKAARQYAAVYSREIPPSAPTRALVIRIDDVHYKNAVASLVVGDANRISGAAYVMNAQGVTERTGPIAHLDAGSAAINGVVGAAMAASADRGKVDQSLAVGLAEKAVAFSYNQDRTPAFVMDILRERREPKYPPYKPKVIVDTVPTGSVPVQPVEPSDPNGVEAVSVEVVSPPLL